MGKKNNIQLPLKIVLTEEGAAALIQQNIKIQRLKMGDKSEEYGVSMEVLTPAFLQQMIMAGYIAKVEVTGIEPLSVRAEIMDLCKLVFHSIVYRNFGFVAQELTLGSEPVKNWNHLNPQSMIDERTLPKEGSMQQFLKSRADESAALRRELLTPISGRITKDEKLQPDEKNVHILLAEKILDSAPPLVWFVLLKFAGPANGFRKLLGELRNCVDGCIKKCAVAEYAALMIMELAANIENINIQKEARVYYKTSVLNMQKILQDPQFRMPVIASMRKKNNLLTFSWKLGGASQSIGTRGKFQVTLFDSDANYKETRDSMEATRSADAGRFNLSEYYKKLQNSGNELELGVYYLSYFNEACEKAGIKFESMVNQTQYSDQTITTLSFVL